MRNQLIVITGAMLVLGGSHSAIAHSDKTASFSCIPQSNIKAVEVLGSRIIVFHLKDHSMILSRLTNKCPGLSHQTQLRYWTFGGTTYTSSFNWMSSGYRSQFLGTQNYRHSFHSDRLCSMKTVVLTQSGIPRPGASPCTLGSFQRLSNVELELLKHSGDKADGNSEAPTPRDSTS